MIELRGPAGHRAVVLAVLMVLGLATTTVSLVVIAGLGIPTVAGTTWVALVQTGLFIVIATLLAGRRRLEWRTILGVSGITLLWTLNAYPPAPIPDTTELMNRTTRALVRELSQMPNARGTAYDIWRVPLLQRGYFESPTIANHYDDWRMAAAHWMFANPQLALSIASEAIPGSEWRARSSPKSPAAIGTPTRPRADGLAERPLHRAPNSNQGAAGQSVWPVHDVDPALVRLVVGQLGAEPHRQRPWANNFMTKASSQGFPVTPTPLSATETAAAAGWAKCFLEANKTWMAELTGDILLKASGAIEARDQRITVQFWLFAIVLGVAIGLGSLAEPVLAANASWASMLHMARQTMASLVRRDQPSPRVLAVGLILGLLLTLAAILRQLLGSMVPIPPAPLVYGALGCVLAMIIGSLRLAVVLPGADPEG